MSGEEWLLPLSSDPPAGLFWATWKAGKPGGERMGYFPLHSCFNCFAGQEGTWLGDHPGSQLQRSPQWGLYSPHSNWEPGQSPGHAFFLAGRPAEEEWGSKVGGKNGSHCRLPHLCLAQPSWWSGVGHQGRGMSCSCTTHFLLS